MRYISQEFGSLVRASVFSNARVSGGGSGSLGAPVAIDLPGNFTNNIPQNIL